MKEKLKELKELWKKDKKQFEIELEGYVEFLSEQQNSEFVYTYQEVESKVDKEEDKKLSNQKVKKISKKKPLESGVYILICKVPNTINILKHIENGNGNQFELLEKITKGIELSYLPFSDTEFSSYKELEFSLIEISSVILESIIPSEEKKN